MRPVPQPGPPYRSFSCPLEPGGGWPAASAALDCALAPPRPAEIVILDLSAATDVDDDSCTALHWLHQRLQAAGSQLWLAGASGRVSGQLQAAGVTGAVGPDAVHHSLRAAVLALHAALPGPGLVTPELRAALAAPAEPLPAPEPSQPDPQPAPEPSPARPPAREPSPAPGGVVPAGGFTPLG